MLNRVTITGADNSVNPRYLLEISQEFPFVEWGILISKNQQGTERFPNEKWFAELEGQIARLNMEPNLSLHLCGSWLSDLLWTYPTIFESWPVEYLDLFQRVQLNWHGQKQYVNNQFDGNMLRLKEKQIIFQFDGVNDYIINKLDNTLDKVPFFDMSHGAGVLPDKWLMYDSGYHGLAGGLTPYNLDKQLAIISANRTASFWIDVETGVRGNSYIDGYAGGNDFNIHKVWKFLSVASKFIKNGKDS